MASRQPHPFEFLQLPKELRFVVYEYIGIYNQHCKIYGAPEVWNGVVKFWDGVPAQPSVALIVNGLPIQLLVTCRLIYEEAKPILVPKIQQLREITPRVIVESGAINALMYVIDDCLSWMSTVAKMGDGAEFSKRFGERTANTADPSEADLNMDDLEGKRMFIRKTGMAFAWQAKHLRLCGLGEANWNTSAPDGSLRTKYGCTYLGVRIILSPWEGDLSRLRIPTGECVLPRFSAFNAVDPMEKEGYRVLATPSRETCQNGSCVVGAKYARDEG